MNCKPGDLALIVRARNKSIIGETVNCIQLTHCPILSKPEPCWEIDKIIMWGEFFDQPFNIIPDDYLMPIRPLNDDIDEKEDVDILIGNY